MSPPPSVLTPDVTTGAYGASKAFVIALTRTMQDELAHQNAYIQLVLAAATRTGVWPFPTCAPETLPGMMTATDLVDAAMAG
jgi:short-subunit dehydrogenase